MAAPRQALVNLLARAALVGIVATPPTALAGETTEAWRFARIADPQGGPAIVSISHVMDALRSDPNLAGLVVRCRAQRPEILIMVIDPFPPTARPTITLGTRDHETTLAATPVPTGAGLVLPVGAESLLLGPWRHGGDLTLRVTQGATSLEGVISLDGLAAAFSRLTSECGP